MQSLQIRLSALTCCISALLLQPINAGATTPNNAFFHGVENRIREADAIVLGRAEVLSVSDAAGESIAHGRIFVDQALMGIVAPVVNYSVHHAPLGYSMRSRNGYWSPKDEENARRLESFQIGQSVEGIFFLKNIEDKWHPFYVLVEDEARTNKSSITAIIEMDGQIAKGAQIDDLIPLTLASGASPMLIKYLFRMSMRQEPSWERRHELLILLQPAWRNDSQLYRYIVSATVAWMRHDASGQSQTTMNLLEAITGSAPSEVDHRYAERQAARIRHPGTTITEKRRDILLDLLTLDVYWEQHDLSSYFSFARTLARRAVADESSIEAELLLENLVGKKSIPGQVGNDDILIMRDLVGYIANNARTRNNWTKQMATLLAQFLGQIRDEIDPSHEWLHVVTNVSPPPGIPGFSGMRPEDIEDINQRQAYIDAIQENERRNRINQRQRILPSTDRQSRGYVFTYLVAAYRSGAINSEELNALMHTARLLEGERSLVQDMMNDDTSISIPEPTPRP